MIIGMGADIVNIARIEKIQERFGMHFVRRCFTESEQADIAAIDDNKRLRACKTAKYFAAKEAAAKALGTGFSCGTGWHDIIISHDALGAPLLTLGGAAMTRALKLSNGESFQTLLSLSDDYPFAQAVVIIEKI